MPDLPRHDATVAILRHFEFGHLPFELAAVSNECRILAETMVVRLPDGAELTAGLRKLLEAKDCFVRAAVEQQRASEEPAKVVTRTCGRCHAFFGEGPKQEYEGSGFCWACIDRCHESTDFAHECVICKAKASDR